MPLALLALFVTDEKEFRAECYKPYSTCNAKRVSTAW